MSLNAACSDRLGLPCTGEQGHEFVLLRKQDSSQCTQLKGCMGMGMVRCELSPNILKQWLLHAYVCVWVEGGLFEGNTRLNCWQCGV